MSIFWNKFYKKKLSFTHPSNFAKFCKINFLKKNKKLLEIGCGNGRDSFYFNNNKIIVAAIDKSKEAIKINNLKVQNKEINFLNMDINSKNFPKLGKFDFIYLRFFLHVINQKSEIKLFNNLSKLGIPNQTLILFEFRTIKDPLFKLGKKLSKYERFTDHYRRFIDVAKLKKFIINKKRFKIIKIIERKGLAKFKTENPVVCRIILKLIK